MSGDHLGLSGDHLGLSGGQKPCYNVVKSPRFRVGGKTERMLNKTQVKEFLSEHFVGKVNKFLGPRILFGKLEFNRSFRAIPQIL